MKKFNRKSLFAKIGSGILAAVMAASSVVSAGAVARQITPSGDTVFLIPTASRVKRTAISTTARLATAGALPSVTATSTSAAGATP